MAELVEHRVDWLSVGVKGDPGKIEIGGDRRDSGAVRLVVGRGEEIVREDGESLDLARHRSFVASETTWLPTLRSDHSPIQHQRPLWASLVGGNDIEVP